MKLFTAFVLAAVLTSAASADPFKDLQSGGIREQHSDVLHWGPRRDPYSSWVQHSNRLIPVYTYGITLDPVREAGSPYVDAGRIERLFGGSLDATRQLSVRYFDQTQIHDLQWAALERGFTQIIVMVFDGMDWDTTRAAAVAADPNASCVGGDCLYRSGRGSGLRFQDERRTQTDFGFFVTTPYTGYAKYDVDRQTVSKVSDRPTGGYDPRLGGGSPWDGDPRVGYLIGEDRATPHAVTDSAASATSLFSGVKTYNGSINVLPDGSHAVPIARRLQAEEDFRIGVVTSVPVSHATPAAAYANNVSRKDYQDLSRDLIGRPSVTHAEPLPGVDVLIGGGFGEGRGSDPLQGRNFAAGNEYLHQDDLAAIDVDGDAHGRYVVAQRTKDADGGEVLAMAARRAADEGHRLLGYFGTRGGHLPFRTADGRYDPTFDMKGSERYTPEDISENPTLAEMTAAALTVLETSIEGFWLMIESGDVDWANHANNIDNSIGSVHAGDEAFAVVADWVDRNRAWDATAIIVTADHGHYLVIDDEAALLGMAKRANEERDNE